MTDRLKESLETSRPPRERAGGGPVGSEHGPVGSESASRGRTGVGALYGPLSDSPEHRGRLQAVCGPRCAGVAVRGCWILYVDGGVRLGQ